MSREPFGDYFDPLAQIHAPRTLGERYKAGVHNSGNSRSGVARPRDKMLSRHARPHGDALFAAAFAFGHKLVNRKRRPINYRCCRLISGCVFCTTLSYVRLPLCSFVLISRRVYLDTSKAPLMSFVSCKTNCSIARILKLSPRSDYACKICSKLCRTSYTSSRLHTHCLGVPLLLHSFYIFQCSLLSSKIFKCDEKIKLSIFNLISSFHC